MQNKFVIISTLFAMQITHANDILNNALKTAVARKNYLLSINLYQEICTKEEDKVSVPPIATKLFAEFFKQDIDDAVKSSQIFNAQLKAANGNEEQLKKVYVDLLTDPNQPGGKIAQKLGISGQLAGALK